MTKWSHVNPGFIGAEYSWEDALRSSAHRDHRRRAGDRMLKASYKLLLTLAWWAAIRGYRATRRYDTAEA